MSSHGSPCTGLPSPIAGPTKGIPDHRALSPVSDIPAIVFENVARQLGVEFGSTFDHPDRSLYRHRPAILERLGVTGWGARGSRVIPIDQDEVGQKNARTPRILLTWQWMRSFGIDSSCRPLLPCGASLEPHTAVNADQWGAVCSRLEESKRSALDSLLVVDPDDVKVVVA